MVRNEDEFTQEAIFRADCMAFARSIRAHWKQNTVGVLVNAAISAAAHFGLQMAAWVAVVICISLTLFVAAFLAFRDERHKVITVESGGRTRIAAYCSPQILGCRKPSGGPSKYALRIQVKNLGKHPAKACRGQLLKVERSSRGVIWAGDPVTLAFAPHEEADCKCKDIAREAYLDVVFLPDSPANNLRVGTKDHMWNLTPAFHELFQHYGDYILFITISSQEDVLDVKCLFHWTGDAESSTLSLVV